jgi:hypothetical protein
MTDHRDTIAAFIDNEPVGAADLDAALAAPDGREYLIDLLVLRGLVSDGLSGGLKPAGVAGRARTAGGRESKPAFWLPVAAAALVAVSLGAGFLVGRVLDRRVPMTAPSAAVVEPAPGDVSSAPAPTHIIHMEKGVDWNERSGGN